jgi:hypothetical protein
VQRFEQQQRLFAFLRRQDGQGYARQIDQVGAAQRIAAAGAQPLHPLPRRRGLAPIVEPSLAA